MATVAISGGTGLIGKALTGLLRQRGHRVVVLTRKPPRGITAFGSSDADLTYALWNVRKGEFPSAILSETDYIVHLAGANVAKGRWTKRRKQEIVRSRTVSGALIVEALRAGPCRVKGVISASATGWYGPDTGGKPFKESDPPADDFLGGTCTAWEDAISPVTTLGKRLVILRTGIVLSREGGALPAFLSSLRLGVAAILGDGKQVISWIHIADLCRLYVQAIEDPGMTGVYNAVAPAPVSNKTLVLALAERLRGRFYVPVHVPSWILRLGMGEMSVEVLKSCTADVSKAKATGFQFAYPTVGAAVADLLKDAR
ncbi:MAG TPA: TIGR01777 family oxidoreductase [Dinghuibacter sp.]|uniref:TIGR01777 family oxidoreductase n=1 Tax=Dinghuibacter sp. TaxID=2024697 RepID=UPI002D0B605D|nr:TIGR01777 family oxidoreductase [Dinghuibacter sp.]HTJ11597.1 TIGR01777 family oxidoreductase [Dinghuibacter sp.]